MLSCLTASLTRAARGFLTGVLPVALVGSVGAQPALPMPAGRPFVVPVPVGWVAPVGSAARSATPAGAVLAIARQRLGLTPADTLHLVRAERDRRGEQHLRFQQIHQGIPVEHGLLTAHYRAGQLAGLSGELKMPVGRAPVPALSEAIALRRALAAVGATHYIWQTAGEEAALRQQTGNPAATYYPAGTLTWVENFGEQLQPTAVRPVVLAWKFNVYATAPLSREWVYVDAVSGEVVLRDAIIHHAHGRPQQPIGVAVPRVARPALAAATSSAPGTFATRYSGARASLTSTIGARFRLRDSTRGGGINTFNMQRRSDFGTAVDFTDNDNNWTAAEYNNIRKDNAALDAHWGTQTVYDYWRTVHRRNSFDGAGTSLTSYVHFGNNFVNAFWNGQWMTYGDGDRNISPLTPLDITSHEIGHGVCEYTARLIYSGRYGQPAALNEGFSDIWGACVEHFADSTKNIWEAGTEIDSGRIFVRSMRNPSFNGYPDTYRGVGWVEHLNASPHRNSTVFSHWFYLLSEGGTGTNDLGNAYTVTGIGIRRAAQITYHLEALYLTPTSNYPDAYRAALAAVADLYGENSPEQRAVAAAWYAVGVGDALPIITGLSPAQGAVGSSVTVTGFFLSPVQRVSFNGVPAPDFTLLDSVHLTVRVPAGATTGRVRVTAPMGVGISGTDFVVTSQGAAPVITSFSPAAGQRVGGAVVITGQHLSGTTVVWFGGAAAASVTVQSATQVTAIVPPLGVTGALALETPGGIAVAPTVCRVLPTLTGFSPTSGPVGTHLTLTGTGLTGATRITVNDSVAALLPGGTATVVRAVVPPRATSGRVRLTTAGGTAVAVSSFVVTASPAPTIQSFTPASGGPNTSVTIRGTGLAGATAVQFGGGFAAASFGAISDTSLTAVVPLRAQTGPISVTTPGGIAVSATPFTVTSVTCRLIPTIETDGPACVPAAGHLNLKARVTGNGLTASYAAAPLAYAPHAEPDTLLPLDWYTGRGGLPIGFSFQFYGRPYTWFNLSSSANIQFSTSDWTGQYFAAVPLTLAPQNFIALAWTIWNPRAGGHLAYGLEGTAPNRQLVISFYKVPHVQRPYDSLSAQIVLHETTNEIDLIYTSTGAGASYMMVGVENLTGTVGTTIAGRTGLVPWQAHREAWRLTPNSVPAPLTYAWTPAAGLNATDKADVVAAPTVPTTYTLTVSDGVCSRTATVRVTLAPATAPAAAPRPRCGPGTVTLTASGAPAGGAYQWYAAPAGGTPLPGATSATFTTPALTATTTYYVATVNAGGCESAVRAARTALIALPASAPTLSAAPAALLLGQSATLAVDFPQPGITYTWHGPGLSSAGLVGAYVTVTPPAVGVATYTTTASAAGGCGTAAAVSLTLTVTAPGAAPLLTSFAPTSGPVGISVTLTGLNFGTVTGVAFAASGGALISAPIRTRTATSLTVRVPVGALPGALRLTYAAGTITSAGTFCVELRAAAAAGRRCGPGPVTLTATGAPAGGSYRWYNVATGGTPLATTATGSFVTPALTISTSFYVAVVAGSGAATCEGVRTTMQATVLPVPLLTIGATGPTTFCQGGYVWLFASGSTEQRWSNGSTAYQIRVDTSGTFTVTGSLFGACPVTSAPITVVVTAPAVAAFSYAAPAYCQTDPNPTPTRTGTAGGRFSATPAGLTLHSVTGAVTLASSAPGAYQVRYTARTACPDSATVTHPLSVMVAPVATLTASGPTTFCAGDSVTLTAAGTTRYRWNTGDTTARLTVTTAGTYTVTGTAANGCASAPVSQIVTVWPRPAFPVITQIPQSSGVVQLTSSAGTGNQWYLNGQAISGATGATYLASTSLQSGTYTVVVTDANGCVSSVSASAVVIVTGVASALGPLTIELAPNPVRVGQATRLSITGVAQPLPVRVLNVLGQTVLRLTAPAPDAPWLELPTQRLSAGVYTVRVGGATRRLVIE